MRLWVCMPYDLSGTEVTEQSVNNYTNNCHWMRNITRRSQISGRVTQKVIHRVQSWVREMFIAHKWSVAVSTFKSTHSIITDYVKSPLNFISCHAAYCTALWNSLSYCNSSICDNFKYLKTATHKAQKQNITKYQVIKSYLSIWCINIFFCSAFQYVRVIQTSSSNNPNLTDKKKY